MLPISSDGGANLYAFKSGNTNEFWQYNVLGQRWITRESVPLGPARKKIKSGSGSGYLGGRIYLTKGGNRNELWAYDITTRTWKQKSDVPLGPTMKKVKTGATATASNTAFYVLKAGNTTEFWSYGPGFDTLSGFGTRKDPGVQSRPAALPESSRCAGRTESVRKCGGNPPGGADAHPRSPQGLRRLRAS